MKLFSRTKRKHDTPNRKSSSPALIKQVLSKLDSVFILKCFLDKDLDALTPTVSEIAVVVNEALQKEKEIMIGLKVDLTSLHK